MKWQEEIETMATVQNQYEHDCIIFEKNSLKQFVEKAVEAGQEELKGEVSGLIDKVDSLIGFLGVDGVSSAMLEGIKEEWVEERERLTNL